MRAPVYVGCLKTLAPKILPGGSLLVGMVVLPSNVLRLRSRPGRVAECLRVALLASDKWIADVSLIAGPFVADAQCLPDPPPCAGSPLRVDRLNWRHGRTFVLPNFRGHDDDDVAARHFSAFVSFFRLVIPPQTNNSSNISVFNRWVPMGACPKCSQIADISRSLADHDGREQGANANR